VFTKNGVDIVEGIELRNGRGLPGGWSSYEVWLKESAGEDVVEYMVATLHCGTPDNLAEGFSYRIEDIDG
jgi:hypothetical protein